MTAALLRRLRLARFRNFAMLDWRPAPGWNRVEAANGAGKTSLLEAIYLVSTGRSFRTAELADLRTRRAAPQKSDETGEATTVAAEVDRGGAWEMAVALRDGTLSRTVQGKPATLAEQLALLPLVVWSEAEHDLVRGGDRVRRRFLDRALLLLEPATVALEAEHARAFRQKRHLLAAGGGGSAPLATLGTWNEILAPHLVRRARARAALAAELAAEANARLAALAADLPEITIDYRPSPAEATRDVAATLGALAAREREESERRTPLVGAQRDRVGVELGGSGARRFASAGEQKIVTLALLAALARLLEKRDRAPLILLDDLESELDPRRAELAARLFAGAAQVISTSSRSAPERAFSVARWRLENGTINNVDSDI